MNESPAHLNGTSASPGDGAFTVQLGDPKQHATLTASASSLDNALDFVCDCCGCETLLPSHWKERDSQWVMKVFDWEECGAPQFPPALGRIIAPTGFVPPPLPAGSLV